MVAREAQQLGLDIDTSDMGEIRTYTMVLGFLPPSKNVTNGWPHAWLDGAKKKWQRHVKAECERLQVPHGLPKIGLHAQLVFDRNQRRDPQNYAHHLWHWVPDALVRCGVIDDDREGMIDIGPNWGLEMMLDTRPGISKAKRQRTLITIAAFVPELRYVE